MASASREWVFGVQTSTARKNHRSGHTEGRLTTTPSGCCVRKGTLSGTPPAYGRRSPWRRCRVSRNTRPMKCPMTGRQPRHHTTPAFTRERARRPPTPALLPWTKLGSDRGIWPDHPNRGKAGVSASEPCGLHLARNPAVSPRPTGRSRASPSGATPVRSRGSTRPREVAPWPRRASAVCLPMVRAAG
jgi:hypothetical protein